MFYVRWQRDESRRGRVFDTLTKDSAAAQLECLYCGYPLGQFRNDATLDEKVQLIAVGPDDEESQAKHDAGRWYSATSVLLHLRCAAQMDDLQLEEFVASLTLVPVVEVADGTG